MAPGGLQRWQVQTGWQTPQDNVHNLAYTTRATTLDTCLPV